MDVPGFEIKKTIGKGGMGTAYLAIQESLGRQVVLKTMNTSQADQTDFLERFLNEGRIVAALRHPVEGFDLLHAGSCFAQDAHQPVPSSFSTASITFRGQ